MHDVREILCASSNIHVYQIVTQALHIEGTAPDCK